MVDCLGNCYEAETGLAVAALKNSRHRIHAVDQLISLALINSYLSIYYINYKFEFQFKGFKC